jgi:cyd operon protein YbgT
MWYFAWMLGVGFAVLLAVMNALWGENEAARAAADHTTDEAPDGGPAPEAGP